MFCCPCHPMQPGQACSAGTAVVHGVQPFSPKMKLFCMQYTISAQKMPPQKSRFEGEIFKKFFAENAKKSPLNSKKRGDFLGGNGKNRGGKFTKVILPGFPTLRDRDRLPLPSAAPAAPQESAFCGGGRACGRCKKLPQKKGEQYCAVRTEGVQPASNMLRTAAMYRA